MARLVLRPPVGPRPDEGEGNRGPVGRGRGPRRRRRGGGDNGLRQTGTLALGGGAELGAGRRARWFVVRRVGHVLERDVAVLLNKSRLKRVSAEAAA